MEDSRDNSYHTNSVREMLLRLNAINDMLKHKIDGTDSRAEVKAIYEERERLQKVVEGMIEVVRNAQAQGMPDDPTARNSLKAARATTVRVPKLNVVDMEGF